MHPNKFTIVLSLASAWLWLGLLAGTQGQLVNLRSMASMRCMDVQSGSQDNNGIVDIYNCTFGATNQLWTLQPISAPYIQIIASHSKKCLTVAYGLTTKNAVINQYDCTDGAQNQLWELILSASNGGYSQIRGKQSGLCVTVASASTDNGAWVNLYDCNEADNQLWDVVEMSAGLWTQDDGSNLLNTGGVILGLESENCITISGDSSENNAVVNLYECKQGASNQQWTVKVISGNYFQLIVANSGKCLTVASNLLDNDTPVNQYTCTDGAENQLWSFIFTDKGKIQLRGKRSGRCVTANSLGKVNGVGLSIYNCIGADHQFWTVQGNPAAPSIFLPDLTAAYTIKGKQSSRCAEISGASQENNIQVDIYDCTSGATNMQWSPKLISGDYFQLVVGHSGKCLTVAYAGTDNNTPVNQYTCTDGAANQLWIFVANVNSEEVKIQGSASGRCLTAAGEGTGNGVTLNIYDCGSNGNQRWIFQNVLKPSFDSSSRPVYKLDTANVKLPGTGMSIDDAFNELQKYSGKANITDITAKFEKETGWHDKVSFWLEIAQLVSTSPLKFGKEQHVLVADGIEIAFEAITKIMGEKPDIYSDLANAIAGRLIDQNNYNLLFASVKGIRDLYQTFREYMQNPPYTDDTQAQIASKFDTLVGHVEAVLPQFLMENSEFKAGGFPLFGLAASVVVQAYQSILTTRYIKMSRQKWEKNHQLMYKFIHRRHRDMVTATRNLIHGQPEGVQTKAIMQIAMYGFGLFNAVARKFFGVKNGRKDIRTRISNEFYPFYNSEKSGRLVKDIVNQNIIKRVSPIQDLKGWPSKMGTARIEYQTVDAGGNKFSFSQQPCSTGLGTKFTEFKWNANQFDKIFGTDSSWFISSARFEYWNKTYDPNSLGMMQVQTYDGGWYTIGLGLGDRYGDWFGSPGYFMNSVMMTPGLTTSSCYDFVFVNVPTVTFRHISSYEYVPYWETMDAGIELDSTNGYITDSSHTGTNEPFLGKTTITAKSITFIVIPMTPEDVFGAYVNVILSPADNSSLTVSTSNVTSTLSPMFASDPDTMEGIYSTGKFKFYEGSRLLTFYKGIQNEVTITTSGAAFEFASLTLTP